ncbi:hypothetical protein [Burkholderia vietnamiensis]|uniref:hypothetical protein n=1 Tax=Burkholderia vietnamiensis TaxID=60552 RepID=UPI00158C1E65|nr:hypothetical protein [Burkholderia vietnamiensis]
MSIFSGVVVPSAAIGSIAGAIVSSMFTYIRDVREQARERHVSVINAVETLENFARACADEIESAENAWNQMIASNRFEPLNNVRFPEFKYPETVVWKWIHKKQIAKLRAFTTKWNASFRYLGNFDVWNGDPTEYSDYVTLESAKLGLAAWSLAKEIRAECGFSPAELHEHERGIHAVMEDRIERYEQYLRQQKHLFESGQLSIPLPPSESQ